MSNRKNQHFVPRFYLKRFSINNNEKAVNIFLPVHERFVEQGSVADQASRNFYYGKDGVVENALSELEGTWSTVLKITDNKTLPQVGSEQFELLLERLFIMHIFK